MDKSKSLSGWLLASDIDGTLNDKRRHLPSRNRHAIRRFVYDCGGTLILASGRSIASMRRHFEKLHLNSGYAVFLNGAGVYDYKNEQILWKHCVDAETEQIIRDTAKKFSSVRVQIVTATQVRMVRPGPGAWILSLSSRLERKYYRNIDDLPSGDWCKAIFTGPTPAINKVQAYVTQRNNGETANLMRSSVASFEVVGRGTNKGVAVMKVAELLKIDPSHTAAIGDYFNDWEMLKAVAVPACCGQAPKKIKEIVKLVTCHCDRGAVADLIDYLIEHYATDT
ncbi:MAG: Cof-type HAD-IIB family hydrolase [Clostridia bacterium]|nr:Cof-type HAD-IIB family hydrolase [Clostridia bacterium]